MTDFRARAARFVSAHFPLADAAFLGGSAATADATDSSDLDILVVLPTRWSEVAFVETTRFEGQLVEAFVYGPEALRLWLDKGRDDRFPVLDRLIGEGVPLTADPPLGPQDQRTLVYDTAAPMLITAGDNAKPNQVRGFARQDVC